ncbi:MAG: helix-turn-helix transcriptional regulator [Bacteroidota bacterium]|nr:helix-turn-helix transcriptional regulator [Bacteroidota bacterium]
MKVKEIEKELLKKLGSRIKTLRVKAGYSSQETFSYECGIPRAQYARYEKGSNITFLSLQKIVSFHKMTWQEFFNEGFDD